MHGREPTTFWSWWVSPAQPGAAVGALRRSRLGEHRAKRPRSPGCGAGGSGAARLGWGRALRLWHTPAWSGSQPNVCHSGRDPQHLGPERGGALHWHVEGFRHPPRLAAAGRPRNQSASGRGSTRRASLLGSYRFFGPVRPKDRQPRSEISTSNLRAAARIRRHARSRSASLTPSTWLNLARAFRTWRASQIGSLRSLGNANSESGNRFCAARCSDPKCVVGSSIHGLGRVGLFGAS
jgi:hypothetical protein